MAYVYRASYINHVDYVNTRRELPHSGDPFDEQPESVNRVDAAAECNELQQAAADLERSRDFLLQHLDEIYNIGDSEVRRLIRLWCPLLPSVKYEYEEQLRCKREPL